MCSHASTMSYEKGHEYLLAYIKVHEWCSDNWTGFFFVIKKPDIVFCLYETPSCDKLVYSNNEHINSWITVILFNIKEVYCQQAQIHVEGGNWKI